MDMVPLARIYSRPEMLCFVAALRAEGILVHVGAFHHANADPMIIGLGGYLVRVPTLQLDLATDLTIELRLQTDPPTPSKSLSVRVRCLFVFLAAVGVFQAFVYALTLPPEVRWQTVPFGLLYPAGFPFPARIPGDYRSRSGKFMQLA